LVWLAAHFAGRLGGGRLAGFWTRHGGTRGEDLAERTWADPATPSRLVAPASPSTPTRGGRWR
jgi:hypothetical protein